MTETRVASVDLFPTYTAVEITEHRRSWIESLRSGRYAQGREYLRQYAAGIADATINVVPGQFCCLGVVEDLRGCRWRSVSTRKYSTDAPIDDFSFASWNALPASTTDNTTALSLPAQAWLGLERNTSDPVVPTIDGDHGDVMPLSVLNDDSRWSFLQIADLIDGLPLAWNGTDDWCFAYLAERGITNTGRYDPHSDHGDDDD